MFLDMYLTFAYNDCCNEWHDDVLQEGDEACPASGAGLSFPKKAGG